MISLSVPPFPSQLDILPQALDEPAASAAGERAATMTAGAFAPHLPALCSFITSTNLLLCPAHFPRTRQVCGGDKRAGSDAAAPAAEGGGGAAEWRGAPPSKPEAAALRARPARHACGGAGGDGSGCR